MRNLVVATRNAKKLRELRRYLRFLPLEVSSLIDIPGARQVREDGNTFIKNAVKKARAVSRRTQGLVLADDSGLAVDYLHGEPGVRSSRFAGARKSDHDNNIKVLRLLDGVPPTQRTAYFVCAVAIADRGKIIATIEERCKGRIAMALHGHHGFGYDPLFLIPPRYIKTFGQLGARAKDRMSHRAKALRKARAFLREYVATQR